jgi:WD40 repeat protein
MFALIDMTDSNNLYVYDSTTGELFWKEQGEQKVIMDLCFNAYPGENTFVTVGYRHIQFWHPEYKNFEKGQFQGKGPLTSFSCASFDSSGVCYTGGANGRVYVWSKQQLQATIALSFSSAGPVNCIRWVDGQLYTGFKDGTVAIINTASNTVEKTI